MSWIKTALPKIIGVSKQPKKQKEFGYLLSIVLFIILGISFYKNGFILNQTQISIIIGLMLVLLFTFTVKRVFFPFLILWLCLGELLGAVTSFLIMGVVYFILFSPISLILRVFRKEKTYPAEWKMVVREIDYKKLS